MDLCAEPPARRSSINMIPAIRLIKLAKYIVLLAFGAAIGVHIRASCSAIAPFDGSATDGPFQLFDALRRIDAGQLPGRDFPAFHGLALQLLHYVPFKLLGSDLYASELTRQLVSRFSTIIVFLLASRWMTGSLWLGMLWSIW